MSEHWTPVEINGLPFRSIAEAADYISAAPTSLRAAFRAGQTTYYSQALKRRFEIRRLPEGTVVNDGAARSLEEEEAGSDFSRIEALLSRKHAMRYGGLLKRTQVSA